MSSRCSRKAGGLTAREHAHRRAILLGIGTLIVLSVGPVFGHHLSAALANGLTGVDHIGALCVAALHILLTPVHEGFHIALAIGLAYAAFDRAKGWHAVSRSLSPLESMSPVAGDRVWLAAVASGLDPARLRVVDGLPNPAFTVGLMSPKVYVSSTLETHLSQAELEAVVSHEAAHVNRRDPLRVSACRFLSCTLFWLPALRRLSDDLADEVEIAADDYAANGRPLVLASAIVRLAGWRQQNLWSGAVGFQRDDLLDRRVLRLAGEEPRVSTHVTGRSLAGAAFALFLVTASGVLVAEPSPGERSLSATHHCAHVEEFLLAHLFCPGLHAGARTERCPHSKSIPPEIVTAQRS